MLNVTQYQREQSKKRLQQQVQEQTDTATTNAERYTSYADFLGGGMSGFDRADSRQLGDSLFPIFRLLLSKKNIERLTFRLNCELKTDIPAYDVAAALKFAYDSKPDIKLYERRLTKEGECDAKFDIVKRLNYEASKRLADTADKYRPSPSHQRYVDIMFGDKTLKDSIIPYQEYTVESLRNKSQPIYYDYIIT
eukprot:jgi/Mesvir1/22162/Mv18764-RA.1